MVTTLVTFEKAARIAMYSLMPNRPYHVQWLVTRKCNYRCKGCNVWQEQDVKELATEEIKKGLDILRDLGVVEIVFSGGDPLLRDDIDEILEYASRFFVTTVYDNGSMAAKKIDALRHVDFVAISLDSLDPTKHDYIKGVKGAWHDAMEAIDTLHENGIRVGVSPTISQLNLHEILDITQFFLKKEIPVWYCLYSYDCSPSQSQLFKIGKKNEDFTITDYKAMVNLCDSLIMMKKKNSNILVTNQILNAVKSLFLTGERTWKCKALKSFFVIDHMGRVAGCHVQDSVASIFNLPKMWNSSKFKSLRKKYQECTRCTYLCYIFYSLHGSVKGNLQIAEEHWRNANLLLKGSNVAFSGLIKTQ